MKKLPIVFLGSIIALLTDLYLLYKIKNISKVI